MSQQMEIVENIFISSGIVIKHAKSFLYQGQQNKSVLDIEGPSVPTLMTAIAQDTTET